MKSLHQLSVGIVMMAAAAAVNAATISLTPSSAVAQQGGQFTFDLVADFGDAPIFRGATDIHWDPAMLSFSKFTFDSDVDERNFGYAVPMPSSLSVGVISFSGLSMGPGTVIGSLTFNAIGQPGSTKITLSDDMIGYLAGGFSGISNDMFEAAGMDKSHDSRHDSDNKHDLPFTRLDVDYTSADVSISAVPLPAAGWLLLTALGGLFGIQRHQARRASMSSPAYA